MTEKTADAEKTDLILDAARKRFDHYGVAKTTMNEIAADIGMSKASLYYYYPDKEQLFLAVIRKEKDEFVKQLTASVQGPEKATKKLKSYLSIRHHHFKKLMSLAKMDEMMLTAMKTSYEEQRQQLMMKEKELVQQIFQQGIKSGEFKSFNAKSHADLFVTSMHGLRVVFIHKKKLIETTEEDYQMAEHYQKQLAALFLESITKA